MNRLLVVPWLVVLWLMLWRDVSLANVASGVIVAVAVSVGLRVDRAGRGAGGRWIRPLALLRFVGFFAWKLVEANVVMAKEIVTPRNHIQTGIIAVPMAGFSPLVVAVTANAVSLTPGTLSVEVSTDGVHTIYVHVLHLHDMARARQEVYSLAERATAAFGGGTRTATDRETTSP